MRTKSGFTTVPFTLEQVRLASFISNVEQPHQDALHCPHPLQLEKDWSGRRVINYEGHLNNTSIVGMHAGVSKLGMVSLDKSKIVDLKVSAAEGGSTFELNAPEALFEDLCSDKTVRAYLERNIRKRRKSYFVIGYRTFIDADQVEKDEKSFKLETRACVPVAAFAGVPVVLGDALDVEASVGVETGTVTAASSTVPGERIFAICYREVKYKWYAPHDVDKITLNPTDQWTRIGRDD